MGRLGTTYVVNIGKALSHFTEIIGHLIGSYCYQNNYFAQICPST